jgi:hypothetical protein
VLPSHRQPLVFLHKSLPSGQTRARNIVCGRIVARGRIVDLFWPKSLQRHTKDQIGHEANQ